ncbi:glycine receptor subunit alpha-3-like [Ruditapes philippinarum]|uniref:glycine receptor subunit alpha-3-like n=1 Tax=Ruditapes philippinarum TaxID=129788 RepID=UPI00295B0DB4|nr:glycine receptor subunit alpha-3-like [Ruditapes philippinarum]
MGDPTLIVSPALIDRALNSILLYSFRKDFLDFITQEDQTFQNNVPPDYDNDVPTQISCELHIENFDSIDEANMDLTATILLHLSWYDHRFSDYDIKSIDDGYVEIDAKNLEKLWVPDIYFPNEKRAYYHNVLMANKMLRIYKGGNVSYSTRLSLTLSCPMNFRNYPFDKQICMIMMESFSYNDGNILLNWTQNNATENTEGPVHLDESTKQMPQFEVLRIDTKESKVRRRDLGNHSRLTVEFVLARNIGYYLVQMYIPSVLVVMLSWISFWLNVNAVPGRISLGVLTVLTMTTQSSGVNASLPHVSYTKAIDIWMVTCLMFVFFALIEFAVANVLMRKDTNKGFKFKNILSIPRMGTQRESKEKEKDDFRDPENGGETSYGKLQKQKKLSSGVRYAMYCDVGSRIMFPVLFGLFNIVYWSYFLDQLNSELFSEPDSDEI